MNTLNSILLQSQQGGGAMQLVFLVAIIVVFYFFMIRPQMKKQKQEKEFRESIQKGAKIVTIGGIHGRILEVNETTFMVEIDTNVKVRLEKSAISADATRTLNPAVTTPAKS
ncbi:MAG: preprotein translocase subunit YajC [Bacteroidetes bacterium]|nr:preprotein translocase subunit YajC [Bacteroidota bacterium]MBL0032068.1 preprotein translocase subunit YajC [Bacteroidota bacterium]MBP6428353.1 preprotein translocase subunit YajC [Bacteroidia bacterium]MBP6658443.1 preprotein translocase subunit YajC [Bacteroidia bacterium]